MVHGVWLFILTLSGRGTLHVLQVVVVCSLLRFIEFRCLTVPRLAHSTADGRF